MNKDVASFFCKIGALPVSRILNLGESACDELASHISAERSMKFSLLSSFLAAAFLCVNCELVIEIESYIAC